MTRKHCPDFIEVDSCTGIFAYLLGIMLHMSTSLV